MANTLPYTRGIRQTASLVADETKRSVASIIRGAQHPGVTKVEIAEILQREVKTIDRALTALEADGAVFTIVKSPHGREKRYTMKRPPSWDARISHSVQLSLAMIQPSLGGEQVALLENLVAQNMTQRDKDLAKILKEQLLVHGGQKDPVKPEDCVLQHLLLAWISKNGAVQAEPRVIQMTYLTGNGKLDQDITVLPFKLVHDVFTGGAYLLGWVEGKDAGHPGGVRTYHLGRIQSLTVLDRPARLTEPQVRELANVATFQIGAFGGKGEPEEAVVQINAAGLVQSLRDNPPALPEFKLTPGQGGKSAVVSFLFTHKDGAARWIRQWGLSAIVQAPASLRKTMADEIASLTEAYA